MLALGGATAVVAANTTVRVVRNATEIDHFDVDAPVEWLEVAPDGGSAIVYAMRGRRAWYWRVGAGLRVMATSTGTRDRFGCGFAVVNGEVITLLAQNGALSGFADSGRELFKANIRSPHSFYPRSFVQLPGGRLALAGSFFSDVMDTVVTVPINLLIKDPEAVQHAIRTRQPIWDRAVDLTVGPCEPDAAVALRDPEDNEVPEDEEDIEELGDVGNFAGVYLRNLDTGALIERHSYNGAAGSGAPIVATTDLIAVQVAGGIDIIRRGSGDVREIRYTAAALDVFALQAAWVEKNGHIKIAPISELI